MINNISWADYCLAIGIFLVLYYALVLFIYFRKDINQIMSGRYSAAISAAGSARGSHANEPVNSDNLAGSIEELNSIRNQQCHSLQCLTDEIEAFLNQVSSASTSKDQLIALPQTNYR